MKTSRLFNLMSILGDKELNDCKIYLNSKYPNREETQLFESIVSNKDKIESKELNIQQLASNLFEGKEEKRIKNLNSEVVKFIEEFLVAKKLSHKNQEVTRLRLLLEIYGKKKFKLRQTAIIKRIKTLLDTKAKGQQEYWQLVQLHQSDYYNSRPQQLTKSTIKPLEEADRNIRILCTLTRLVYECESICKNNITPEDKIQLSTVTIDSDIKDEVPIKLYTLCRKLLLNPTKEHVIETQNFLFKHLQSIIRDDATCCFAYIANVYAGFLRANQPEYAQLAFEAHKQAIEHGIILGEGRITAARFHAVLALASNAKKFDWAYGFIKKNKKALDNYDKTATLFLAEAILLFGEEKFKEVHKLIESRKCKSLANELVRKAYLVATEFEIFNDNNIEKVERRVTAFSRQMQTKKMLHTNIGKAMQNFLSIVKKLLHNEVTKQDLSYDLQQFKNIYMRFWLERRIDLYRSDMLI